MSLETYRKKRDFSQTPEPRGKVERSAGRRFVVQKHDASRLHYDFRLELDGVLKSWAVPKGPSLDPREKRLAVEVEDHPLSYEDFEGIIPEGEYGGGTVIVWDRGTWEPLEDPHEGLEAGKLKFALRGEKLGGEWALVRSHMLRGTTKNNWLLMKLKDEYAQGQGDVLEEEPNSVKSGRSLRAVAEDPQRVWGSNRKAKTAASKQTVSGKSKAKKKSAKKPAKRKRSPKRKTTAAVDPAELEGAKKGKAPEQLPLQLATLNANPPAGDQWAHEIKFDGYRMAAYLHGGQAKLLTRQHKDWTHRFQAVADSLSEFPVKEAVLDGEVVVLRKDGVSDFQALQNALREGRSKDVIYYVFDALHVDGYDLRKVTLADRKNFLKRLFEDCPKQSTVRYSEHIVGHGPEFMIECQQRGLEGMISKRLDRPYFRGRNTDWLKTKCTMRQEFVIGGYTDSTDRSRPLGAVLVGYFDDGQLTYAGRVGTGWDEAGMKQLQKRFSKLEQPKSPFGGKVERLKGVHWLKPDLVGEIAFSNWTRDDRLRHPSFQGLREDKPARQVRREEPQSPELGDAKVVKQQARAAKKTASGKKAAKGATSKKATKKSAKSRMAAKAESNGAPKAVSDERLAEALEGVRLTSPEKVLFPDAGFTKLDLAAYYVQVADAILPHIVDRPLSLVRCPQGARQKCFYQKHAVRGTPDVLARVPVVEGDGETAEYLAVQDLAGLLALVQLGVLEIHPWGSRADEVDKPDRMIIDLDPDPAVPWSRTIEAALAVRDRLDDLGLQSFVKTTGGKGLHAVVPLDRRHTWAEIKGFSRWFVRQFEQESPGEFITTASKAGRKGKIFLDYLRNDRGSTAVAAFSTRAKPGAPVAAPLRWDELSEDVRSDHYTIQNIARRLASLKHDPWQDFFRVRQSIPKKLLQGL